MQSSSLKKQNFVLVVLLVLLCLYPFFFRLNLGNSNYEKLDILLMVSPHAWILLSVLCGLLALHAALSKKFGLLHLSISLLLSYGLFVVSQYPTVLNLDFWVHTGSARQLILAGSSQVDNSYVSSWPGSYILWVAIGEITSLSVNAVNVFLSVFIMGASAILLYLLGRKYIGAQWAGLPGLLYLVTNVYAFQFLDRDRFSPFNLAFLALLLCFYIATHYQNLTREHSIILLVAILAIVVSHLVVAMFVVSILLWLFLIAKVKSIHLRLSGTLALLAGTFWIAWWMYNCPSFFEYAISLLSDVPRNLGSAKITGVAKPAGPSTLLPTLLGFFYFRAIILIVCLIALLMILKSRDKRISDFCLGTTLGAIFFGALALLAPIQETNVQWSRILSLSLLPITYTASLLLAKNRLRAMLSVTLLIFLVVPSFLTSLSFLPLYVEVTHSWEVEGFQFLSTYTSKHIILESDKFTARAYGYYYDTSFIAEVIEVNLLFANYTERINVDPCFFRGNRIIRSFKQEIAENTFLGSAERSQLWENIDSCLNSDPLKKRIYDNGLVQIYENLRLFR